MRNLLLLLLLSLSFIKVEAQGLDELKQQKESIEAKKAPIQAQVDAMNSELSSINDKISGFPGWYKGAFGTLGANFTGRNNWFAAGDLKNSKATTILGSFNAFANNIEDAYFWRNSASLNLGWQKLKTGNDADNNDFKPVADVLNITSLFGYNISPKFAASSLGEYRTSVIRKFNDPGYLDIGVGATYTPLKNMIIVLHPLNYNFVISSNESQFTSSLGCKFVADYNNEIYKGIKWRSNLTGFLSYKSQDPQLHNGTWTNWFGFSIFKGVGVGIEHGFRYSPQETKLLAIDNKLQSYYVIGLSYAL